MPRPTKERVICKKPLATCFSPKGGGHDDVILSLDEYEVLRLHDLEKLPQTEVARQMLVSRTSVTAMLSRAHAKLAKALVEGYNIRIEGGNCRICEIGADCPKRGSGCKRENRCSAHCRTCKSAT